METLGHLLRRGTSVLRDEGHPTPDLDARLLLAHIVGLETSALLARREVSVEPSVSQAFDGFVLRRCRGEPVHRIIGRRGFYGEEFTLSPETLEPRPDTETLVDLAIEILERRSDRTTLRVLDIGTGSGIIAIAILKNVANASAIATDISEGALVTATMNARQVGVADRYDTVLCEYLDGLTGPFDLVVSNPPYIPSREIDGLSYEVRTFDPRLALDGGADGLTAYRAIAGEVGRVLAPTGSVVVEIGIGQAEDVAGIFQSEGFVLKEARSDYGGIVRALHFRSE